MILLIWKGYSKYTHAEEQVENKRQKNAVSALINKTTGDYRQEEWDKTANRKTLLNKFLKEIQKDIMGTSAETSIVFFTSVQVGDTTTRGFYAPDAGVKKGSIVTKKNTVYISESHFSAGRIAYLRYVAHELRHCYQHESYNKPSKHIVSQLTNDKWEANYANQVGGSYGDSAHMQQPIEWDAYYFTGQIARTDYTPDYSANWDNN